MNEETEGGKKIAHKCNLAMRLDWRARRSIKSDSLFLNSFIYFIDWIDEPPMRFEWIFSYLCSNFWCCDWFYWTHWDTIKLYVSFSSFNIITNWYSWVHLFCNISSSTHFLSLSLFSCVDFFYYRLYDNTGSTIHMTEAQFFPALFRNKFNFRTVGFFLQFSYSILTIFHFVFRKKHRRRRWYGRKIIINTFRQVDSTSESEKNRKCETKIMWPAYGG